MMKEDSSFTLIEIVMAIVILGIVVAVAVPVYIKIDTDARNAATKAALGGIRTAIQAYRLNEVANGRPATYPHVSQITGKVCWNYNPTNHIMANADIPANPWASVANHIGAVNETCVAMGLITKGRVLIQTQSWCQGWLYNRDTGEFWANSAENDGTPSVHAENECATIPTTENCF